MVEDKKYIDLINRSGFPLQIGIANLLKQEDNYGWKVLYTEHSWQNKEDGTDGFIDIVLEDCAYGSTLVIECKRVQNSSWIFLQPDRRFKSTVRTAKAWVTSYSENMIVEGAGWTVLTLNPASQESGYCVVEGQDEKKPMLERIAATVVAATESIAQEDIKLLSRKNTSRMYFSVIITTAELVVGEFDPGKIAINDGTILPEACSSKVVPWIRFVKQLSTRIPIINGKKLKDPDELTDAKTHTVFIVNSSFFHKFLEEFMVRR